MGPTTLRHVTKATVHVVGILAPGHGSNCHRRMIGRGRQLAVVAATKYGQVYRASTYADSAELSFSEMVLPVSHLHRRLSHDPCLLQSRRGRCKGSLRSLPVPMSGLAFAGRVRLRIGCCSTQWQTKLLL